MTDVPDDIKLSSLFGLIITRNSNENLPPNAKPISIIEVPDVRSLRMKYWIPQEDVWSLRHGSKFLASLTFLTSSVTHMYIRRFFQLQYQKIPTTFIGGTFCPLLISVMCTDTLISRKILSNLNLCDLCMELRGSVIQTIVGSFVPLWLSVLICIPVSKVEKTYPIPKLTEYYKFYDIIKLSVKRGKNVFITLGVLNFFLGGFLTNRMLACNKRMIERDEAVYQQLFEQAH